eukprot:1159374-Pelagomonas_calceolata.AAC.10
MPYTRAKTMLTTLSSTAQHARTHEAALLQSLQRVCHVHIMHIRQSHSAMQAASQLHTQATLHVQGSNANRKYEHTHTKSGRPRLNICVFLEFAPQDRQLEEAAFRHRFIPACAPRQIPALSLFLRARHSFACQPCCSAPGSQEGGQIKHNKLQQSVRTAPTCKRDRRPMARLPTGSAAATAAAPAGTAAVTAAAGTRRLAPCIGGRRTPHARPSRLPPAGEQCVPVCVCVRGDALANTTAMQMLASG